MNHDSLILSHGNIKKKLNKNRTYARRAYYLPTLQQLSHYLNHITPQFNPKTHYHAIYNDIDSYIMRKLST